jgi:hypothetical protein
MSSTLQANIVENMDEIGLQDFTSTCHDYVDCSWDNDIPNPATGHSPVRFNAAVEAKEVDQILDPKSYFSILVSV